MSLPIILTLVSATHIATRRALATGMVYYHGSSSNSVGIPSIYKNKQKRNIKIFLSVKRNIKIKRKQQSNSVLYQNINDSADMVSTPTTL